MLKSLDVEGLYLRFSPCLATYNPTHNRELIFRPFLKLQLMRSIKIIVLIAFGFAFSAYRQLHKPSTLPQYHRLVEVSETIEGVACASGSIHIPNGQTIETINLGKRLFNVSSGYK